jgi:2-C-methyl-D-erythritol 4-phosphate cytidylyltransferase
MSTFAVILPAAGQSTRFKDQHYKKVFAPLESKPVWLYSAEKFVNRDDVKQVILVISPEDREHFQDKFSANAAILGIEIVEGGATRTASVMNALARVKPDIEYVAVHDAARPCLANEWISSVFEAALKTGAAILAIPVNGTLKRAGANRTIAETVSRENLWEAQTPQVFRKKILMDAYARFGGQGGTDDAQLVEQLGQAVTLVPGSPVNLKITTKEDLRLAVHALKALPKPKGFSALNPFAGDDMWR